MERFFLQQEPIEQGEDSQMYASEDTLKKGIASVAKNAPEAPVVEEI